MADQKISELTALTGANVADDDAIAIVDTSATETKKIVFSELKNALDTATGFVRITGDTMTGNLSMGDNVKAIFGAGSDLQIYHDGSNSYISDQGEGNIYLRSDNGLVVQNAAGTETVAVFAKDDACELFYNNSKKLATTSTGVDITGTLTSDGLTVDGGVEISAATATLKMFETDSTDLNTYLRTGNGEFRINTANDAGAGTAERFTIDHATGDISFYEDTGTTPKFFWDASAESLGIGNSTPSNNHANANNLVVGNGTAGGIANYVGTGLGWYAFSRANANNSDAFDGGISYDGSRNLMFHTNAGSERMRIDSSGNLLVGKTATDSDVVGVEAAQDGHVYVTVNNTLPLYINRQSGDEMLRFASNGSTVGSIGVNGGDLYIENGVTGISFNNSHNSIIPTTTGGNVDDANQNLGISSHRWKDLHLSGTIEIENGTGNVGVGKQALNSNTGSRNTAIGLEAGEQNITGNYNVFVGSYAGEQSTASQQTFVGENAGYLVTTGEKNTILGRYNGNQGGLDIRTSSNNIVLSDGDGNPRLYLTAAGALNVAELDSLTTASSANVFIATDGFLKKSTSSLRYKNTVNDATHGLTELLTLRPVTYKGNNDGDTVFGGLIAEEVHDAGLTEFVQYNDDGEPDALAYGNMVSLCIKAIQEQQATITALEARITALENA
jgi:hypothetical protein